MAGYQWAWSRFRILRITFFLLLIVGFSPLVPTSLAQHYLIIETLWGVTLVLLGLYLWTEMPQVSKAFRRQDKEMATSSGAMRKLWAPKELGESCRRAGCGSSTCREER